MTIEQFLAGVLIVVLLILLYWLHKLFEISFHYNFKTLIDDLKERWVIKWDLFYGQSHSVFRDC